MLNLVKESGTGIQKSGTGIQSSGTGIGKSGTGSPRRRGLIFAAVMCLGVSGGAVGETGLNLTRTDGGLVVSLHDQTGVYVGRAASASEGYVVVPVYSVVAGDQFSSAFNTLIHGSGSGSSGEAGCDGNNSLQYHGSGSGDAGERACNPNSFSVNWHGSGSGDSGESTGCAIGLEYHGSGSGSSSKGEGTCLPASSEPAYHGSGSGASGDSFDCAFGGLEYHGSGSGSEKGGGCSGIQPWGVAEVAFDTDGASVVVHQFSETGTREHVVAFLPMGSISPTDATVGDEWESNRGFVLAP